MRCHFDFIGRTHFACVDENGYVFMKYPIFSASRPMTRLYPRPNGRGASRDVVPAVDDEITDLVVGVERGSVPLQCLRHVP